MAATSLHETGSMQSYRTKVRAGVGEVNCSGGYANGGNPAVTHAVVQRCRVDECFPPARGSTDQCVACNFKLSDVRDQN
jgi:hypothetical protein